MHILAILPWIASAQAAITILYPTAGTIWYRNNTVAMNWTVSDPGADTYLFRTFLSNADSGVLASQQQIADSTNATAQYVRIALPRLPAAQGYVVSLVNTTNPSQVLAKSEAFEIQDGEVTTTTASSTPGTQTATSFEIPNAVTTSDSFPSSAFPTGSTGAGQTTAMPWISSTSGWTHSVAMLGVVAGAAAVLL